MTKMFKTTEWANPDLYKAFRILQDVLETFPNELIPSTKKALDKALAAIEAADFALEEAA